MNSNIQTTIIALLAMKTRTYLTLIAVACLLGVASSAKAATYSWNGSTTGGATGSSNIWDTNTTANWTGAGTLWPASGTDNDAVFGGTAGTVTIAAGGVTANDITFNTTGYTLTGGTITLNGTTPTLTIGSGSATISSNIAGSVGLTKSGSGTVTLSAPVYSYTGATSITGGKLVIDASAATAHGFYASSGFAISGGGTLQLQTTNVTAYRWGSGQITGAGTFQRTGAGSIYFGNPATSFNQSAGGLADFQGGTSLYVQTQATNLGGLTVNNATITLSGAEYFDALNGNGTINSQDAGALVVGQNNGSGTFAGTFNGTGRSLTKNGTGTQILSGANTYTGSTTVNAGELDIVVGAATANTTYYPGAVIVNGGKLVLDASSTPQSNSFFNASGYAIASGATMELRTGTAGSYNWSVVTSQITGAGTFLRTGSNTINFANPAVSLNQSGGGLADFEGGTSNYVKTQTTNLGGLTINNATVGGFGDVYFDALKGNGTLTSMDTGTFNLGVNGGSGTFTGTISNAGGTRALTKVGNGTLTLSGSNSYNGATQISAGILEIGSTGRINGSSGIAIDGTTAEFKYNSATALTRPITLTRGTLSGTGSINTAVTIGSSAILSPGNSPGSQSFTQGLTFGQGGQYTWEINNWAGAAGTAYDQLVVSGSALNITATSGSTFKILVTSLTGSNTAGAVSGFVGTTGTSFTIATSSPAMAGFDKSKFTIDSTTAFGNVNTLPTNAGFWVSTNGGSTSLILNYAPSATYNLSAAASATAIRVGGTSTITATVTSSTASLTNPDTMSYTGLALSGGVGAVSSTSGTLAPGGSGSGTVAFIPVSSGSFTFSPSVTTATNVNIATSANAGTSSGVAVTVWNPAVATTSGSVNLGSVIVGSTSAWTRALSVTNSAPNNGFSESLNASFGSLSGVTTNSGSFNLLAAGSTNNAALAVTLATGSVGNQAGSAQILFATDGQGTSGLAAAALSPQTVNVYGTVLDHALPGFVGAGIADPYAQTTLNLDFGSVDESAGPRSLTYSLTNLASLLYGSGLTAGLDLIAFTPNGGGFTSGLTAFDNLTAGGTSSLFTASFTPSGQGTFSKIFTLSFSDNRNLAGAAAVRNLTINTQVVVVPEPGAIALAGIGVAAAACAYRRRRKE